MIDVRKLEAKEIFIKDEQYYMKIDDPSLTYNCVNLETGELCDMVDDVTETNLDISVIWE